MAKGALVATRDVFSEELGQVRGFPEAGRGDLIRYLTLTTAEETFVRKFCGRGHSGGSAWFTAPVLRPGWGRELGGHTPRLLHMGQYAVARGARRTAHGRRSQGSSSLYKSAVATASAATGSRAW
jgi:hypothetical protein